MYLFSFAKLSSFKTQKSVSLMKIFVSDVAIHLCENNCEAMFWWPLSCLGGFGSCLT